MREDKLLFDLLEQKNWVRCPGCGVSYIVEDVGISEIDLS
jgi:hypothetical protein